jgi:tripartite-type tricarboxylate transporter receptor subunit TctC
MIEGVVKGHTMDPPRRQFLRVAAATAALLTLSRIGRAQTYPTRPITMIVPYGAGGPTDTVARILADGMREALGQPIIIENIAGASATIGVERAARAASDGYTVCIGTWASHVLNGAVFTLRYDLLRDFEPIAHVANDPQVIIARNDMPANSLTELIAWLRANPGKATQGTGGAGSTSHIAGVLFQRDTNTRVQFVPYRLGVAAAMQDLIAGRIDLMFSVAANCVPQLRAGTIKGYAVTAKTRLAVTPEVPTVDEAGLAGFYLSNWHGIWAPKRTPNAVILALNAAVVAALANSNVRRRFADLAQNVPPIAGQTPEALGALQRAEIEKWWPIVKAENIKAE